MFKSFLKVAFRNIFRNKIYSSINIVGLGIGIAGSLLILVYVVNQLSYESMNKNRSQIVRVAVKLGSGGSSVTLAGAMPPLGPAAASELPEVKAAVRFRVDRDASISVGHRTFTESGFFFADSNVFNVFTFPLVAGNKTTALDDPSSIVISENIAQKYFGDADPLGKTLVYDKNHDFTVTGVMKNVPENTMLRPELIAPYSRAIEIQHIPNAWGTFGEDYTYLYLRPGADVAKLPGELEQLLVSHTSKAMEKLLAFEVVPLSQIHFTPGMMGELGPTVTMSSVNLFSMVAILVLIVACLNFVNLSTARSMQRSKEVGLRKVVGAGRSGLMLQFFGESLVMTLLSLALALLIFELAAPSLYGFFNVEALANSYLNTYSFAVLAGVVLFVAAVAGIYPAVFLSRYAPVDSLRGTGNPGSPGAVLRKGLVVAQFAIAVFLIISTAAIYKQIDFMRNSDLGFNKSGVILVDLPESPAVLADKYPVLKQAFSSVPGVRIVSGGNTFPGFSWYETQSVELKGTPESNSMIQTIAVGQGYLPALGLKLIEGRNFSERYSTDSSSAVILNRSAVRYLGIKDPIGAEVYIPSGEPGKNRLMKVIGVIKDFHVASFQKKMGPLLLYIGPQDFKYIALKVDNPSSTKIIAALESKWREVLPGAGFNYSFLSEKYDSLYKSEDKIDSLISIFTLMAVLIGCMGMFGLVSYSAARRTKEIGVRKVLGASVSGIVSLLSREFAGWVVMSNIIAWPVAYYIMNRWLADFAYRVNIGISLFVASGVIALLVALLTVSSVAIKAATVNPVESLRYE